MVVRAGDRLGGRVRVMIELYIVFIVPILGASAALLY